MIVPVIIVVYSFRFTTSLSTTTGTSNHARRTPNEKLNRRKFLNNFIAAPVFVSFLPDDANASETIGKDPDCNGAQCLGVWDGLLADCPHGGKIRLGGGAGCASSQDDTPGVFAEPWDYADSKSLDWENEMKRLISTVQLASSKRGDKSDILLENGRYLRVLFTDGKTQERSIGEFYFTPNDTTVQFRVGSLPPSLPLGEKTAGASILLYAGSFKSLERCESIRKQMGYLKLPVLRNRKRLLFFGESDAFDSFGPGSAALGPPAEMRTGELEGRQDVDPNLRIDIDQSFPFKK